MGRLRSLMVLASASLAACADQGPSTPAAIVLTPTIPRVPMGGTLQLDVAVVNVDGEAIEGEPVTLESAEPEVVTVDDAGLLTSVGLLDTVTITATSGGLSAAVEAQVVPPPSSLVVIPRSLRMAVGDFAVLYIVVTDEHGDSIPDPGLVLEVDNPAVVRVGASGEVFAQRSGLATIFVINGDRRVDVPVSVTP